METSEHISKPYKLWKFFYLILAKKVMWYNFKSVTHACRVRNLSRKFFAFILKKIIS